MKSLVPRGSGRPLLFVLAIEFLAQSIRESNAIQGLNVGNKEVKLTLYADDITALIRDETSAHHLFVLLKTLKILQASK